MKRLLIGVLLSAALGASLYFFTPPLSTEKIDWEPTDLAARSMSDSAVAGMTAFGDYCSECHGALADGGSAPSLTDRAYALDFRDSPRFHSALARDIPAHRMVVDAARGGGRLSFNELELMSKFLRESRGYQQWRAELNR